MTCRKLTPFTLPIPGFGERKLNTEGFVLACERESITVTRRPLPKHLDGYCYFQFGRSIIVLDSRLRGTEKLQTEFHELAHHYLHNGRRALWRFNIEAAEGDYTPEQEWAEMEADAAAFVALNPFFHLDLFLRYITSDVRRRKFSGRPSKRP